MQVTIVDLDSPALIDRGREAILLRSEYDRVQRLARKVDRRRFAASIVARKCILGELTACVAPMGIRFIANEYGSPSIANGPDNFHFSISRSERWMVLATGTQRVGVDIEHAGNWRYITRFLRSDWIAKEEAQQFTHRWQDRSQQRALVLWWTAREAYSKLMETGLRSNNFQIRINFDTWEAQAINLPPSALPILGWWDDVADFQISLAVTSREQPCVLSHWTLESGLSSAKHKK